MAKKKYLELQRVRKDEYFVRNMSGQFLGKIEKHRVGRFIHWNFITNDNCYLTSGCMYEIIEMLKNPEKYINKDNGG